MIKSRQKFLNLTLVIIDAAVISLSLYLAWFIRFSERIFTVQGAYLDFDAYMEPLIVILPLYLIIYNYLGLYKPQRLKRLYSESASVIKANIIGVLVLVNLLFIIKQVDYSRLVLLIFMISSTLLCILERGCIRLILRAARKKGFNLKHILVIGADDSACSFSNKIKQHKYLGFNIIGFLDDDHKIGYKINGAEVIGRIDKLSETIQNNDLDEIIIAIPLSQYNRLNEIIKTCEKYGVKAQIIPDYYKYIPAKPYVDQLDDLPIINIRYVPLDDAFNKAIKRTMDILISVTAIILVSPIMLITALIIKLTSPGPMIFKQTRIGLHRREFEMYKFRSMKVQAPSEEKTQWSTKNDPRKTKFGELIRKTSIDELPQLFNVLKGEMSIIGPRPERPYFVEKFREEIPKYMIKHHVRPGITGWAQVNGYRGDTSIKARIEHDIYYIENWNLMLDIRILFLTFIRGFINKNAY